MIRFTLFAAVLFSCFISVDAQTKKKTVIKKPGSAVVKKKVVKAKPLNPPASAAVKATRVRISTDSGVIIVRLYDSTPLHRDNFVNLVKQGFYDSLLFHRVIPNFMIQGGDPTSKTADAGTLLGNGGDNMPRITAEILPQYFHKRGVLAAARDGNPEKKSSACQFYLVEGKKLTPAEIQMAEERTGKKFTDAEKKIYETEGGTPWLDGNYTVFGETESGFDVIDKIANMSRDSNNRPLSDIRMKIELINP